MAASDNDNNSNSRGNESAEPRTASTVTVRATPVGLEEQHSKKDFWNEYLKKYQSSAPQTLTPDECEARLKNNFGIELRKRFISHLSRDGSAESNVLGNQEVALRKLVFTVKSVEYRSVDIATEIKNLGEVMSAFALSSDDVITILGLYVPGALNAAIDFGAPIWQNQIVDASLESPRTSGGAQPRNGGAEPRRRLGLLGDSLSDPQAFWKLINAMWALPIVLTLVFAYVTYREMNERIRSYDKDLLQIKSDEIQRIGAFFDKQFAALLDRYEKISKESAERIHSYDKDLLQIKSDEIRRAGERSNFFDQQFAALLVRYEGISKENAEIVKTLIQKTNECCVRRSCDPPKTKDARRNKRCSEEHR